MLGRNKTSGNFAHLKMDTVIGPDTVFEGNLVTRETTRVDGVVKGEIKSEGTVILGTGGKMVGNIQANVVLVAGEIQGDITASVRVEASSTGRIFGNIITKALVIDENAVLQGKCTMNEEKSAISEEVKSVVEQVTEA